MPIATLTYNLPEDESEFNRAVKGAAAHSALWDVGQEVFRPARKHGYTDTRIQRLIEALDELVQQQHLDRNLSAAHPHDEYGPKNASDLIGLLEERFHEIVRLNNVEID